MGKEDRDERLQRLKEEIEGAFRDIPYPGDDNIAANKRDEYLEDLAKFKGKHWRDLTFEFLVPFGSHTAFFTTEAFRFYLPAFLIISAEFYYESDSLSVITIGDLVLPFEGECEPWEIDRFHKRFDSLTAKQKRAIKSFLEFIRDTYPYDPIYNDHLVALERYWQYM